MQLGAAAHLAPESLRLVGPRALVTLLAGSGLEFATVDGAVGIVCVSNRRCSSDTRLRLRLGFTLSFPNQASGTEYPSRGWRPTSPCLEVSMMGRG